MAAARLRLAGVTMLILGALLVGRSQAGKVVLKNGFEIPGTPINVPGLNRQNADNNLKQNVPQTPYWAVDDGIRRYFVHRQNLLPEPAGVDQSDETSRMARFKLEHLKRRVDSAPIVVGPFAATTPWDKYGRCTVTLNTPKGPDVVSLSISRFDPRYLSIESTSHNWDFGLHPNAIPLGTLREALHQAIDPQNPDQRMGLVTYLLQADLIAGAKAELESIREDFPELAARIDELQRLLLNQYGGIAIREIHERRAIGQHGLARYLAQRTLQEDLPADILRDAQAVLDDYAQADQQMATARMLLSSLQGQLSDEEAAAVSPFRSAIDRELNYDTLPRLEPLLRLAGDDTLSASEKLGLAMSAWVLGPSEAKTSLKESLPLWDARFLMLQYLHPQTDFANRQVLLDRLNELEGISVRVAARMAPQLPTPIEFPGQQTATVETIELPPSVDREAVVRYSVLVPPEYSPTRSYPAVVVLSAEGRTIEQTTAMWGGSPEKPGLAQRQGYIVIAPEYAPAASGIYDYGRTAHEVVLAALFDARQRLNIDSDRVFLAGHGMGGDAAFDLGLAHPDLWAGVMPITGRLQHAARLMKDNASQLPFYVVGGERDRDTLDTNASAFALRMQRGWDFVYCEYKQRGFELYLEELPRLFEWMARIRRPHVVRELNHTFLRDFDNRVGWLKWVDLPPRMSEPIVWGEDARIPRRPLKVSATIPTSSTIFVTKQPGKHTVLWLSPEMVDYEQKLKIRINGSAMPVNPDGDLWGYPAADLAALLDDLRERGDRQMLYWTRLEY
ncbi:MAG: hypothetical protein KDA75_06545 [Planctomycetaceae bacterium]|nr:hypothetical protein [Planctomycetaceae bacterium]